MLSKININNNLIRNLIYFLYRCYVGTASRDQWRPCSDHYYPYSHDPHGGSHGPPHGGSHGPPHGHFEAFHYESYGPPRYWPVAYLHKDAPPNSSVISSPGDKDLGIISSYGSHIDGYENYVDNHRANYGKKIVFPSSSNISQTASITKLQVDKKPDALFEVVEENGDSSGLASLKNRKLVGSQVSDKMTTTTTSSPVGITKLQPRFVTSGYKDRKMVVARDTTPSAEAKQWSWRDDEKSVALPVEFRRKAMRHGNSTSKPVQFELVTPRATVTKL